METPLCLDTRLQYNVLPGEDFGSLAGQESNWPAQTTLLDSDFLCQYPGNLNSIHWSLRLIAADQKEIVMAKKETKKPAKPLALGKIPKPTRVVNKTYMKFQ